MTLLGLIGMPMQSVAQTATWHWYGHCPRTHALAIRISLDERTLFYRVVPICQTGSQDQRVVAFGFKAPRPMTWSGYGEQNLRTSQGEHIDGNLWQAAAESNRLLFGMELSTKTTILANARHSADPAIPSRSMIEPGLVITTSPAKTLSGFFKPGQ
jgi:hypothetical protein